MQIQDRPSLPELVGGVDQALTATDAPNWGWLPALSLVGAFGVFLVALADNQARARGRWAELLLWTGLLTVFVPFAVRLMAPRASRVERVGLVVVLGLEMYAVSLLRDPTSFTDYDGFLHWQTAQDIVRTGHLFHLNPLLPISSLYPGMEIVTTALSSVSGLSIFQAAVVVVGVARLVLVLGLYLFFEQVSGEPRVAGVAALLYMANPHFLFFDATFAYESLALPLGMLVLFALSYHLDRPRGWQLETTLIAWLALAALVITHHLTSYVLLAFLLLWTVAALLVSRGAKEWAGPGRALIVGLVMVVAWTMYVGGLVIYYLTPHIVASVDEFIRILMGQAATRQLFHDYAGQVAPLWERVAAFASVGLILLGLPLGLVWIWRHQRTNAAAVALAAVVLAYPVSQAFRLTQSGAEMSDRATEFLFVAVAFVLATGAMHLWQARAASWARVAIAASAAVVIFVGGVIAGNGPTWNRLPGPYLVSADARSIGPEGVDAATWVRTYLGPGHRIATDRVNQLLMGTYGLQYTVTVLSDRVQVAPLFSSPQLGSAERAVLRRGRIQYIVVDRRLSTGLPRIGVYFDTGEPLAFQYSSPISAAALAKFDATPGMTRLFDSGDIVIYVVGAVDYGP